MPMEAEILLQNLEHQAYRNATTELSPEKTRILLNRFKALESALADLLRLNHERNSWRGYKRSKKVPAG